MVGGDRQGLGYARPDFVNALLAHQVAKIFGYFPGSPGGHKLIHRSRGSRPRAYRARRTSTARGARAARRRRATGRTSCASPHVANLSGLEESSMEGRQSITHRFVGPRCVRFFAEWVASTRNPQPPASSSLLPGLSTTSFFPPTTPFTWLVVRQQPTTVLYTQQCVF